MFCTMKVRWQCGLEAGGVSVGGPPPSLLVRVPPRPRPAHHGHPLRDHLDLAAGHLQGEHAQLLADARQHRLLDIAELAAPPRPLGLQLLPSSQQLLSAPPDLNIFYLFY